MKRRRWLPWLDFEAEPRTGEDTRSLRRRERWVDRVIKADVTVAWVVPLLLLVCVVVVLVLRSI